MAAIPQAQNGAVFSAKQLAQLEVLEVRPQHFQNMPNAMRQSAPRPQASGLKHYLYNHHQQQHPGPTLMAAQRIPTQALNQRPANASATAAPVRASTNMLPVSGPSSCQEAVV